MIWKLTMEVALTMVPDVISYSAAVSACERAGEWTQALQLLDEAHECREVDEMTLCLG